ncbi:hypothetical protein U2F10_00435 [Leptothoe sp. EHU-05/26/07-4]
MIYFIAAWGILSVISWLIGIAIIIGLRADCFDRIGDRIMAAFWLGVVLLANGLLLISLALPLSPIAGLAVAMGVGLPLLCWPAIRAEIYHLWQARSPAMVSAVMGWTVLIAIYMTTKVTWFDTGLYHFGAVRWLSKFGTVPGLALVLNNLGFTSSWFALAAPLTLESVASRVTAVANGWVFLIITCHGFLSLGRWFMGKARITDKFMVIFLGLVLPAMILSPFLETILISSSPDIPVIFLSGIMAWSILAVVNRPQPSGKITDANPWNASLIPLFLALGAIAIKLSALPLLPVALLFYWQRQFPNFRRLLIGCVLSLLLLTPLIVVSIVTSGCPLYPSSMLCVNVPWRVPTEVIDKAVEVITFWEHNFGDIPPGPSRFLWQLWEWLQFSHFNIVMLILMVLSAVLALPTFVLARKQKIYGTPWLLCCSVIGMVFVMVRAPMVRFGLGYFVTIPAIGTAVLSTAYIAKSKWQLDFSGFNIRKYLPQALFVGLGLTAALILFKPAIQARLLLPPKMPSTGLQARQSYDVQYVKPANDNSIKCWDAPIPCTYNELNIRLRNPARGLRGGFIPAE